MVHQPRRGVAVPLGIGLALLSGWAVFARRYRLARVAAAAEVALLLAVGAGAVPLSGRPDLRERRRLAGDDDARRLVVFGIGALFLIPSLWFLFTVFKADLLGAVDVGYGASGRERRGEPARLPSTAARRAGGRPARLHAVSR